MNGWARVEGKVQDRSKEGPVSVVSIVGRFKCVNLYYTRSCRFADCFAGSQSLVGHAVAQLVEALHFKPKDGEFDF